jgi:hypothetical protein
LVIDIRALKFAKRVEQTLKNNLNLEGQSRLTAFSINRDEAVIRVLATVNTVTEFDATTETVLQNALASEANRPIELQLEQVVVKAGAIKKPATPLLPASSSPSPPVPENLSTLRIKTMGIIRAGCDEAGIFLAPWPVRGCAVSFGDGPTPVTLQVTIGRDLPLSEKEERWLTLAVEKKLGEEVTLKTATVPLLPDLAIDADGLPDAAGKKALGILKELTIKNVPLRLTVSYPPGTGRTRAVNQKKAKLFKGYLEKELGIAAERVVLKAAGNSYRITVQEEGA